MYKLALRVTEIIFKTVNKNEQIVFFLHALKTIFEINSCITYNSTRKILINIIYNYTHN